MLVPAALVWLAVLWFLSRVDEGTSVAALIVAWLMFASAQATMWATVTTSAMSGLRPALYPHGASAFAATQQLAGAAFGAVFISAYTIGSGARDAGVLSTAQAVSAGQAAFLTAGAVGLLVLLGALLVRRTPGPAPTDSGSATGSVVTDEQLVPARLE